MKKTILFFLLAAFTISNAQISLDKIKKKVGKEVEKRVEKKIDRGIDKTLDKAEETIDKSVTGEGKEKVKKETTKEETTVKQEKIKKEVEIDAESGKAEPAPQVKGIDVKWNRFDFRPGTEIIFEDDLKGEQNGEFPSKWDVTKGTIENATVDGENVIQFIKCNTNSGGGIVPLLKNSSQDYLPEEFTVEFDAYFEKPANAYTMYLLDYKNQRNLDKEVHYVDKWVRFEQNSAREKNSNTTYYPGTSSASRDVNPGWRHFSISFNTRALKVYIDDARVLNIPNLGYNPTGITMGYHNPSGNSKGYVKNFKIAKGAVPLYDKMLSEGKIVTTGIRFDVNMATIKPESMGVISDIVDVMKKNEGIKFSVEGHTDSDGETKFNMTLSEARAKAVMAKFIELGIEPDRLKAAGFGESKPVADNNTPEGKALNRRVEFVKF